MRYLRGKQKPDDIPLKAERQPECLARTMWHTDNLSAKDSDCMTRVHTLKNYFFLLLSPHLDYETLLAACVINLRCVSRFSSSRLSKIKTFSASLQVVEFFHSENEINKTELQEPRKRNKMKTFIMFFVIRNLFFVSRLAEVERICLRRESAFCFSG